MLQRAASNAYSWWWASHIRTKQSKWLEQSMQDMEEKVQHVLKLIEEDGDSFAKRAEMYYKKRPELISFVEESYRAFRALAERYDKISTELQNANTTIATVFPEQVQFAMDEEDESNFPKMPKNFSPGSETNVPKVPNGPNRDIKGGPTSEASKKLQAKRSPKLENNSKSGLSKEEALEEIDKLQKEILALQTVKEFVKSSYETGLAKFSEIEKEIIEKQDRVISLQDEFSIGRIIEDDEARNLMAETALRSCEQTLARLHEKQERSRTEARSECTRIEDAREKLNSLKHEYLPVQTEQKPPEEDDSVKSEKMTQSLNQDMDTDKLEVQELEALRDKIKEHFNSSSGETLTVSEMAEKIDELVNKVISLESAVSSQTALIDRLRTEIDDLQAQIRSLEDEKASLINDKNDLINKLKDMEIKLKGIQGLNENVENQNSNLLLHFTEARCSLDQLSEKLPGVKPDEENQIAESLQGERASIVEVRLKEDMAKEKSVAARDLKGQPIGNTYRQVLGKSVNSNPKAISEKGKVPKSLDELSQKLNNLLEAEEVTREKTKTNWQEMLLNGIEDREKILLTEYSAILRDYKDLKKQLSEVEKNNGDSHFEMTVQLREMRGAIAERDEEIQSLRQKLNILQENFNGSKYQKDDYRVISVLTNDRSAKPESPSQKAKKEDEDIKLIFVDESQATSQIEEKLRKNVDAILDENLDFWLRFSTSFHQIQKFRTEVKDLQDDISKFKEKEREKMKKEGSCVSTELKSDVRAIYKHLREIQTELTVWSEKSVSLKDELRGRFSSLCSIQEDITTALKEGVEEDEMKFTSYQAAKFQGEVLNMKQENNKVRDELQVGLDHVSTLQLEIEKTLAKLNDEYQLSGSKSHNHPQLRHSETRSKVPLRAFIFGTKPKKQKHSIFSCMSPALHRKNHGFPM